MGCFLACFGFTKKKKRRKSSKKSPSAEQVNNGSYVPLDSDASIKENHFSSESHQQKEKPKKKVSFNLNVKAYEPIPNDDDGMYLSDGEEETKWEFNSENKNMATLHYEEDTISSSTTSHPANYRYQNCRDSYDELKLDEDDLDFDDIEDSDEEVDNVFSNGSDDDDVITNKILDERNTSLDNLDDLQRLTGRDRSKYVMSVLNPVENLTQWKVVKAKAAKLHSKCQKENLISKTEDNPDSLDFKKMRKSNVAVDASLSNWLGNL